MDIVSDINSPRLSNNLGQVSDTIDPSGIMIVLSKNSSDDKAYQLTILSERDEDDAIDYETEDEATVLSKPVMRLFVLGDEVCLTMREILCEKYPLELIGDIDFDD